MRAGSRAPLVLTTLAAAVTLGSLYSVWPRLTPGWSEASQGLVAAATEAIVAIGAGVLLWHGSWTLEGRGRLSWRLMGTGVAVWGLGSVAWFGYILTGHEPPAPGLPDVMYLTMIPLVIVGLAMQPVPRGRDRVLRSLVDGSLVAASLILLAWTWFLRDIAVAGVASSPSETVINTLYPVADIVIVVMAVTMMTQALPSIRFALGTFAVGITILMVSDLAFGLLNAGGIWEVAPLLLDSGWVIGFAVIGGAGCSLRAGDRQTSEHHGGGVDSTLAVLPSWLAATALLFGVIDVSTNRGDLGVTVPMMLGIAGLLLARQALSVRQGRLLAERLERSVRHLAEQATHDRLTGLHNRVGLPARLEAMHHRDGTPVAVLFADVDHLKTVNDSLGHEVGDRLIRGIADHLALALGPGNVTRFGGDEFVGAMTGEDVEEILSRASWIVSTAERSGVDRDLPVVPSMSAGLALWEDDLGAEEVMRRADTALVMAKRLGRRRVVLYEPDMDGSTRRRVALEPELVRAIPGGELAVLYQPVVSLHSGKVLGAEALVRWNHPEQGVISPEEFLGHADAVGLLERIGDVVLDTAIGDFAELNRRSSGEHMAVSVNMSAGELASAGAVRRVSDALNRHGLDPALLTIEITEDVVVDDHTRRTIDLLRGLGIGIAIDDFGTGNSSLRQLGSYPATSLKVDRSFVEGLGRRPQDSAVVRAVLNLAHALELRTVAEGVERIEQVEELKLLGCDAAQGWYFAKAQPIEHLRAALDGSVWLPVGSEGALGHQADADPSRSVR